MFRKKTKTYHAAAGEIRCYREQTVRLNAHRVTPVINAFGCTIEQLRTSFTCAHRRAARTDGAPGAQDQSTGSVVSGATPTCG